MNYTEEELCTLVDQLPDIQYNLQMPVTSINLLGLTPDLFDEEVYEILKDYFTEQKYNVLTTFLYHDTSLDMAGYADVNIVVSVKGLKIAELLKEKFSVPVEVLTLLRDLSAKKRDMMIEIEALSKNIPAEEIINHLKSVKLNSTKEIESVISELEDGTDEEK